MILIGSRALNEYVPIGRPMHDWDFFASIQELSDFNYKYGQYLVKVTEYSCLYDILGTIVEIRNPNFLDATDKELLNMPHRLIREAAAFGEVLVPSIQVLYDIKKATAAFTDELKHKHDIALMQDKFKTLEDNTDFFTRRLADTERRYKTSTKIKYDFFHKYHIPEYIVHDRLHDMFADSMKLSLPTYKRITTADVDISEELFNKLTHEQKVSLMAEESLVLAMERWFIPQMIENGINYRLLNKFYNNNEAMPTYLILKHCCITGLKGEKEFITDFARKNFFEIEKKWLSIKQEFKFPNWFLNELFELRDKYKKGEIKATI